LGGEGSIHESAWPTPPAVDTNARPVTIAVQVNGKSRGAITARKGATQDELVALVEGDESIAKWLIGERIRIIHVQDRMISFVIKPAA
jgi:leucyl-tRNA synthetase